MTHLEATSSQNYLLVGTGEGEIGKIKGRVYVKSIVLFTLVHNQESCLGADAEENDVAVPNDVLFALNSQFSGRFCRFP